jgi:hypothetical protein
MLTNESVIYNTLITQEIFYGGDSLEFMGNHGETYSKRLHTAGVAGSNPASPIPSFNDLDENFIPIFCIVSTKDPPGIPVRPE